MKSLASVFVLCALFSLTGCATQSLKRPAYLQELAALKVDPDTYARIYHGRVLRFEDVLELVRKGVPGSQIVAYLKQTHAPYQFNQTQINKLVNAGADSTLINFVGKSAGDYLIDYQDQAQQNRLRRDAKAEKEFFDHPYFTDPYYWGPAPFPWDWPVMW